MSTFCPTFEMSTKRNTSKTNVMKNFIGLFEEKNSKFYQNGLENQTFYADNRKQAIEIARRYARHNKLKFICIRLLK